MWSYCNRAHSRTPEIGTVRGRAVMVSSLSGLGVDFVVWLFHMFTLIMLSSVSTNVELISGSSLGGSQDWPTRQTIHLIRFILGECIYFWLCISRA